ncbi:gluconate:proton symporter [Enterococcus faecium]|uniref:gluconate:proton symporter n=1 Tax=Enterococcus TaxID=1350 RepID=UPI00189AA934|nr:MULTISPECIES: gluconate:proton symporter [Enterococcus]EME7170090.1 gluconate:proton symporter [Enterococcus faecium]MDB7686523.1 gluconate:proton symporter [Enterococcus faecium]MDV5138394.1 gluconate:proton symporter [Enterococcus lactis]
MNSAIVGFLLAITFIGFVAYAMRGGNLTVGFFVMAVLWTIIGGVPLNVAIKEIFTEPVLNYGKTAAYIIFGSWFGRVLVDTGIAGSISRRTEKIGKKSPVLATILIALVIALIFTSSYGVGSAIAVGVILFPIMFSIGVPKNIAVSVFTFSIGAAMYVNNVLFVQFQVFFPEVEWGTHYQRFGFVAMAIQMVIVVLFILFHSKKIRNGKREIITSDSNSEEIVEVPVWTYVLPILPVALSIFAKWDAAPALLLSIIIAFAATGNMKSYTRLVTMMNDTAKHAISDIAGLLIMLFVLTMFQAAAVHAMSSFTPIFQQVIPHNKLILVAIIAIIAPLSYFRGPLMLYGAGAATAAILVGTGIFDQYFLYGLLVVPSMMGISACITQSWNLWSVEYAGLDTKTFLLTGLPWAWGATVLNLIAAYILL